MDEEKIRELWSSGLRNDELADALGVTRGKLTSIRERYGLPIREVSALKGNASHKPDPTEEEIAERASLVRAGWSKEQEESRWAGGRRRVVATRYTYDIRNSRFSPMDA